MLTLSVFASSPLSAYPAANSKNKAPSLKGGRGGGEGGWGILGGSDHCDGRYQHSASSVFPLFLAAGVGTDWPSKRTSDRSHASTQALDACRRHHLPLPEASAMSRCKTILRFRASECASHNTWPAKHSLPFLPPMSPRYILAYPLVVPGRALLDVSNTWETSFVLRWGLAIRELRCNHGEKRSQQSIPYCNFSDTI